MSAPSRKQLVNFVSVTAFGPSAGVFERMTVEALLEVPSVREVWLKRHRELQAALSSEDESAREGMVSVVDYEGRIVGSMGVEPWQSILSSEDATRPTPEGHGRTGSNHLGNPDVGPLPRWDATRPTGDKE